jgi:hypothetical protein
MIQKSCQIFSDTVVKNTKMYSITVKIYSSSQQSLKNNFFEISDIVTLEVFLKRSTSRQLLTPDLDYAKLNREDRLHLPREKCPPICFAYKLFSWECPFKAHWWEAVVGLWRASNESWHHHIFAAHADPRKRNWCSRSWLLMRSVLTVW